jgi:hypothetical protein
VRLAKDHFEPEDQARFDAIVASIRPVSAGEV